MVRTTNSNRKRVSRRKLDNSDNGALAPWANLPNDVLVLILMQLGVMDILAFGGVCKSWRSVAIAHRDSLMAPQQPFTVIISSYAKRACSLFNVFGKTRYKTMLPDLTRRTCIGLSCGFLVMLMRDLALWLVNPITRRELHFPILPPSIRSYTISHFRAILVYSTTMLDYLMVVMYKYNKYIYFCRSGGDKWAAYSFAHEPWDVEDLAFFKGKIYFLTRNARIGLLKLGCHPFLKLLDVSSTPTLYSPSMELVASNERLLMVAFCTTEIVICELDFTSMEWVKIENLGEEALFLSDMKCSAVVNPTKWGGRGNCIYLLESVINLCSIFSLDGRRLESAQVVKLGDHVGPLVWYFPHRCFSTDLVHDCE